MEKYDKSLALVPFYLMALIERAGRLGYEPIHVRDEEGEIHAIPKRSTPFAFVLYMLGELDYLEVDFTNTSGGTPYTFTVAMLASAVETDAREVFSDYWSADMSLTTMDRIMEQAGIRETLKK